MVSGGHEKQLKSEEVASCDNANAPSGTGDLRQIASLEVDMGGGGYGNQKSQEHLLTLPNIQESAITITRQSSNNQ